jgi:membrane dipeptidase
MMVDGWAHHRSKPQDFQLRIERICDHIDHICQLAGHARAVGIGSDLDGGFGTEQTPMDLDSIADLQSLSGLLSARGYSTQDVEGILHGNFIEFLRRVWR